MTAALRIGEVATRTGLTVRTLRHYESIGLLEPVERSESGYRLYRAEDAERLYAIVALRQLGLSLAEIRAALDADPARLQAMVERHADEVRSRIGALGELQTVLERLGRELGAASSPSLVELCELVRLTAQAPPPRRLEEEPAALHLLGEPLSGRILDRLHSAGPASAAGLAQVLAEPADVVERQLERLLGQRFVEQLPPQPRTQTRWRVVDSDLRLPQVGRTEETDRIARSWFEPSLEALAQFVGHEHEWASSATLSNARLRLTRDELERFGAEYIGLVRRYARPVEEAPDGARPAVALLFAFPSEDG